MTARLDLNSRLMIRLLSSRTVRVYCQKVCFLVVLRSSCLECRDEAIGVTQAHADVSQFPQYPLPALITSLKVEAKVIAEIQNLFSICGGGVS